MSESLLLWGTAILGSSGVPGLFAGRNAMVGQWLTTTLAAIGAGLGLGGVAWFWATGESQPISWPSPVPGAEFGAAVDGLSALFLVPIFLIALLGNIYGLGYWRQSEHPRNGRRLRFFYGVVTSGMALLVVARNSVLFLFGWEIMALSAFFLVMTEEHKTEARQAAWIYLIATHTASLCLFALFAMLRAATGRFDLTPVDRDSVTSGSALAIFILALVGFGLKAGIVPLHVWLPGAHAAAPTHVSALMSGVLIKMGVYGLLRVTSLLPDPPLEWGGIVLGLGVVSGIFGVAFAIGQHDLKRLLAYHSIENIGIIVMGLGLALLGRSLGRVDLIVLGLGGGLLHVWNHAIFKALLFFSAGSVIHATHTRDIDHLGGLAKSMPSTAFCFLIGAIAICGLPPLNGFISEFLVFLGLFSTLRGEAGTSSVAASFAAPALALIGALALACFVKVYGAVFLGTARSEHAERAGEAPLSMLGPMGVLVGCCFLIGLAPFLVVPLVSQSVSVWAPNLGAVALDISGPAPLGWITAMNSGLIAALVAVGAALWLRLRRSVVEERITWSCGYVALTPRMQYTSSSFSQILVGLLHWVLRPRIREPKRLSLFPRKTAFHSDVPDTVLDGAVLPAFRFGAWLFSLFRWFQRGSIQVYLLYVFIALIALLLWR